MIRYKLSSCGSCLCFNRLLRTFVCFVFDSNFHLRLTFLPMNFLPLDQDLQFSERCNYIETKMINNLKPE